MISRIINRWLPGASSGTASPPSAANSADRFHQRLIAVGDIMLRHRWTPLIIVLVALAVHVVVHDVIFSRRDSLDVANRACAAHGEWFDLDSADTVNQSQLIHDIADRPMVLLGKTESADLDEGRWLGFTVAALYGSRRHIVIALDAFPPSQQLLLDRWVQGELGEAELLGALDWRSAYTPDPQTFAPLFRLARLYHLPLLAIGMDAEMVEHFERENWAAIPVNERQGDGPVEPAEGYRRSLAALHLAERLSEDHHSGNTAPGRLVFSEELTPILVSDDFRRFMQARRAEDWLIAHKLIAARQRAGRPLVVGVIGRNHLEYRWGVPDQLAALGDDDAAILLPFAGGGDCALIRPGVADAVFILEPGPLASTTAALPLPDPIIGRVGGPAAARLPAP